jgi:hypothetical protein
LRYQHALIQHLKVYFIDLEFATGPGLRNLRLERIIRCNLCVNRQNQEKSVKKMMFLLLCMLLKRRAISQFDIKMYHSAVNLFMAASLIFSGIACTNIKPVTPDKPTLPSVPSLLVPHTDVAPEIDGDTSDEVWQRAALIRQLYPARGATSPAETNIQTTTVRVLWDESFLYVAFDCVDDDVYCSGTLKHDDDVYKEDVCEVFLDGKGDGRQYVEIQVAPNGVNLDLMYVLSSDSELGPDFRLSEKVMSRERWGFRGWEMEGLKTAGKITPEGWSAELAIPAESVMKRLGSKTFFPAEIRAHFMRYDWIPVSKEEERRLIQQNWSPVPHGNPHNSPALMGRLILSNDGE